MKNKENPALIGLTIFSFALCIASVSMLMRLSNVKERKEAQMQHTIDSLTNKLYTSEDNFQRTIEQNYLTNHSKTATHGKIE